MTKTTTDFFTPELAAHYDERNRKLSAISENLHFLTRLVLEKLPPHARILSVGAGTGADILPLARAFPHWRFVAVEPSKSMLEVCRERMAQEGFASRCEFVHGYASDVPASAEFDACLSILVGHFVGRQDRAVFYQNLTDHLKPGGIIINAEISFNLNSPQFPAMLQNWEKVQTLMGATPESLRALPTTLKEILTVLAPEETEDLLRASGIEFPIRFYQAFMISAWHGTKAVR